MNSLWFEEGTWDGEIQPSVSNFAQGNMALNNPIVCLKFHFVYWNTRPYGLFGEAYG